MLTAIAAAIAAWFIPRRGIGCLSDADAERVRNAPDGTWIHVGGLRLFDPNETPLMPPTPCWRD